MMSASHSTLHAHHQVVARHVQAAALVVHAHHAEVLVVVFQHIGVLLLVGCGDVVGELLLDLDEGGALGDELVEKGGRGRRGGVRRGSYPW